MKDPSHGDLDEHYNPLYVEVLDEMEYAVVSTSSFFYHSRPKYLGLCHYFPAFSPGLPTYIGTDTTRAICQLSVILAHRHYEEVSRHKVESWQPFRRHAVERYHVLDRPGRWPDLSRPHADPARPEQRRHPVELHERKQ